MEREKNNKNNGKRKIKKKEEKDPTVPGLPNGHLSRY